MSEVISGKTPGDAWAEVYAKTAREMGLIATHQVEARRLRAKAPGDVWADVHAQTAKEWAQMTVVDLGQARAEKAALLFDPAARVFANIIAKMNPFMTKGEAAQYYEWYAELLLKMAQELREDPDAPLVDKDK